MKKIIASILIAAFIMLQSFGIVCAAGTSISILEVPNIKIVIDGKMSTYKDVPISVNQKTMLPLRELLVNLGVPNDEQHIIWNTSEKSVTIYKDKTKVYLKQGDITAYVNDEPVKLDVAPLGYSKNSRTYIPARFVAQALGKKVVWDPSANAVLIREESAFNEVKTILEKSSAAMKAVKKSKLNMDMLMSMGQNNILINSSVKAAGEIDSEKKTMHMAIDMKFFGMSMQTETYMGGNATYTKNPMTDTWEKVTVANAEYLKAFNEESNIGMLEADDIICAGLTVQESKNPDEILLKGDVYLSDLYNKAMQEGSSSTSASAGDMKVKNYNLEISIDKKTSLINKIIMNITGTQKIESKELNTEMEINISFSDYNGSFEIKIPDEVVKNAVESASTSLE